MNSKKNIAIFASGRGSNARSIYNFSKKEESKFNVSCILSNRKNAGVLEFAKDTLIPRSTLTKKEFRNTDHILEILSRYETDLIVLAGFLWLIPKYLVDAYPKRILNIHPAILPKYGGKGMYGKYVHEAIKKNNEAVSGMTIHFVNEVYDDGQIIFQSKCQLENDDAPDVIAERVLRLEHLFYPKVVNGVAGAI